ncbi:Protein of unknown function DUF2870 [Nannochloropsis gaditana]|uniref:Uncharacterized protein n=1 Tax=Nannochloropsis gaditana TaxID=72520 RepID=W7U4L4_9STRA|nr:Protein of unknown function DUF2870 [Nannochloropsis gaditana]
MVVLHVKRSDGDEFLYETTCETKNEDLIQDLVWVWNARLLLQRLVNMVQSIPQEPDELGVRSNSSEDITPRKDVLVRVAFDAEAYLGSNSTSQEEKKTGDDGTLQVNKPKKPQHAMSRTLLQEQLDNFHGAIESASPSVSSPLATSFNQNVKQSDGTKDVVLAEMSRVIRSGRSPTLLQALSSCEANKANSANNPEQDGSLSGLDPTTARLWAMGKKFVREKTVGEQLGGCRNEKTKIVVKLAGPGQGPPVREPVVREEERLAMLAHYFKRQEELKRLAEAEDDEYLHAEWADGKQLQRGLRGVGDVGAPGIGGVR